MRRNEKKAALLRNAIVLLLISLASTFSAEAQKTNTGNWFGYFGNQSFKKKWNWHNEVQYRNYNFAGDLEQLMLRTGIGYNLSENNNNILQGYAYILTGAYLPNSDEKQSIHEHRIFQQFITKQHFSRFYLQHRYRIEERILKNDFKLRFRYLLGLNIPITKPLMDKNAVYASLYNEVFLSAESPVFDRDRIYGAIGFVINKYMKAEVGVMSQVYEKRHRNQFQLMFFNNMPFGKN